MKEKRLLFLALVFALCLAATPALADFMVTGWADNGYTSSGQYPFDTIEFFIVNSPGASWSGNGVDNFRVYDNGAPVSGWGATQVNPEYVLATGPTFTGGAGNTAPYLQWDMSFLGSQPVTVDYLFTAPGADKPYGGIQMWSDGTTNYANYAYLNIDGMDFDRSSAVPEPATLLLLGFGLCGISFVGRKRLGKTA